MLTKNRSKILKIGILSALIGLSAVQLGESLYRYKRQDYVKLADIKSIVQAYNNRKAITSNLLGQLSAYCDTSMDEPVGILLQEVQVRLFYDERIHIISTDGIVSKNDFKKDGCPDFLSLLKNGNVDVIMHNPSLGTTKGCTEDKEISDMVQLFQNREISEIEYWKKILYVDYPEVVFTWYSRDNKMPILIRKSKRDIPSP